MTYIVENPIASLANRERTLITIEFAPDVHPKETEYNYPHPQFVFGDRVINKFNPSQILIICALELIEPKTPSGRLLNQPRWKYKVNDESWYEESVLIRQSDTCAKCTYFQDYHEERGRGWCHLFNDATRKHHLRTHDCDLNSSSSKTLPYSEYDYGDLVKIIDLDEDHDEWATFEIVEKRHNLGCCSSTNGYLSQPEWYYLISTPEPTWVKETEICHAAQSHLIETKYDIF